MTTTTSLDSALAVSELSNRRLTIALTRANVTRVTQLLAVRLRSERVPAERQVLTHLLGVLGDGRPSVRHTFKLTDTLVGYLVDTVAWYGSYGSDLHRDLNSLRRIR